MNSFNYINLGCGSNFHEDWVNIDFVVTGKDVIAHNLNLGIPFENDTFDVVYHSHVLEHFSKDKADFFIQECYRVLKNSGILRVVVPDLEQIVIEYQKQLQIGLNGNLEVSNPNYDWILIELFDQMVRNQSGGLMAEYIIRNINGNEEYIYKRIGNEVKKINESCLEEVENPLKKEKTKIDLGSYFRLLIRYLFRQFFKDRYDYIDHSLKIGKFRQSGEIHQWMYDRYSLSLLLKRNGFKNIQIKTGFESNIPEFSKFNLDVIDNEVRKPDSLFIEATK